MIRTRNSLRWAALAVVVMTALGIGVLLAWPRDRSAPTATEQPADPAIPESAPVRSSASPPEGVAPSSSAHQSAVPQKPIEGGDIASIREAWAAHWRVPVKYDDFRTYGAIVDYPPGPARLRLGAVEATAGASGPPSSVICMVSGGTVDAADPKLLDSLVEHCLGPALRDRERTDIRTWVGKQVARGPSRYHLDLERFTVVAVVSKTMLRLSVTTGSWLA